METLINFFQKNGNPSDEFIELIKQKFYRQNIKKNCIFHLANTPCKYLYFIEKGVVIAYTDTIDYNETIREIYTPNMWLTDMDSLINQTSSNETFKAVVEELVIYKIQSNDFLDLLKINPKFSTLTLQISAQIQDQINRRFSYLANLNSQNKIHWFNQQHRFQNIKLPKKIIADYLQIRPETFSRNK